MHNNQIYTTGPEFWLDRWLQNLRKSNDCTLPADTEHFTMVPTGFVELPMPNSCSRWNWQYLQKIYVRITCCFGFFGCPSCCFHLRTISNNLRAISKNPKTISNNFRAISDNLRPVSRNLRTISIYLDFKIFLDKYSQSYFKQSPDILWFLTMQIVQQTLRSLLLI